VSTVYLLVEVFQFAACVAEEELAFGPEVQAAMVRWIGIGRRSCAAVASRLAWHEPTLPADSKAISESFSAPRKTFSWRNRKAVAVFGGFLRAQ